MRMDPTLPAYHGQKGTIGVARSGVALESTDKRVQGRKRGKAKTKISVLRYRSTFSLGGEILFLFFLMREEGKKKKKKAIITKDKESLKRQSYPAPEDSVIRDPPVLFLVEEYIDR
jgi:hypothetical protein